MAIDDIYQLSLVFNQSGREWLVVEYYRLSTDDATKTVAELSVGLVSEWVTQFWDTALKNVISVDVDLIAMIGQKIHPTRDFQAINTLTAHPGTVASPPLPAHTCALIHQTGGEAGRSFQGRVYLSGMPSTFQAEGKLNALAGSAYTTHALIALGENVLAPIGGSPAIFTHTNFSKKLAAASAPVIFSDIRQASIRPQLATQRNRTLTTSAFAP